MQSNNEKKTISQYSHLNVPGVMVDETLSNEELIYCVQNGIGVKRAKEFLVQKNRGLVYIEANKCTAKADFEDIVQYGFEALLVCIDAFNLDLNIKFSTFAIISIRRNMYRRVSDEYSEIAIPEYLSLNNIKITRFISEYMVDNYRSPSNEEIAAGTDLTVDVVERTISANSMTYIYADASESKDEDNTIVSKFDVMDISSKSHTLNENSFDVRIEDAIKMIMDELTSDEMELLSYMYGLNDYPQVPFSTLCSDGGYMYKGQICHDRKILSKKGSEITSKIKHIITRNKISVDMNY